jgi:acyl-CoA reductase-like NAD-dependent aldehyde dehydrogenase
VTLTERKFYDYWFVFHTEVWCMIEQEHIAARCWQLVRPLGSEWKSSNLLWGTWGGSGDAIDLRSPADGSLIQRVHFLDAHELDFLLQETRFVPIDREEVWLFAARLHAALDALSPLLLKTLQLETAFTKKDCEELLGGTLAYVRDFRRALARCEQAPAGPLSYQLPSQVRRIHLTRCAWGTIAVILPQNAFLLIAVTTLLNALATGNRVILRAPQQSARSAALLSVALQVAEEPWRAVSVVLVRARTFIESLCRSRLPVLIHYLGSSQHAPQLLAEAFRYGKPVLVDGSGNGWVWVDADVPMETACNILTAGALRYNGQTCTSINGAMIHPSLYPHLRRRLIERWGRLTRGNPLTADVDVGPLFDEAQAKWCQQQMKDSGGRILCGGGRNANLLHPTLVENPALDSTLMSEGLFGSGLWVAAGDHEEFVALWQKNRYPLCAGVLSPSADVSWWISHLPNLARLMINGDPSVEYIFEPWGGYPASSMNPVGIWHEKYQRAISIDEALPSSEL